METIVDYSLTCILFGNKRDLEYLNPKLEVREVFQIKGGIRFVVRLLES